MDTAAIVSLIGSTASALATVVLVVLTGKYVRLTHALVEETRSAKFPNVFVDIEFDSSRVKFIVGNAGTSSAVNVSFSIKDSVPWRQLGEHRTGLSALPIVQDGISYLAPGRVLKFEAGYIDRNADFFASGSTIEVGLTFETETGKAVSRQFSIDLRSYTGVLFESFADPEREVAQAIRDAEFKRSSGDPMRSVFSRIGKKSCPSCGEQISSSAKKCPKCHEFVPPESSDASDS